MAAARTTSLFLRYVLLVVLSVAVMVADHRSRYLQHIRTGLAVVVAPLQAAAVLPERVGGWIDAWFTTRSDLNSQIDKLQRDQITAKARLQRLETLETENNDLRRLLAASQRVPDEVLLAELIEVSLDPYNHRILVNRGLTSGVVVDQPVLDPEGIMGQVTQVMPFNSAVTLITDPSHAVPVRVQRNGVRAVAFGTGNLNELVISYLTANDDVRVGDVLVTSGLGGRFPPGYPVASVANIEHDSGEAFLRITARPMAKLGRARHVLLLKGGQARVARPAEE